jgi:cobyrinic acid a,c-diamide synthase
LQTGILNFQWSENDQSIVFPNVADSYQNVDCRAYNYIILILQYMKPRLLIAAAHSGAGKTTVTLGLLRALQKKGHKVQPFKCGPDYIDPMHHRIASGNDSINLDRFMMSDEHIRQLYHQYGATADVCITEGVMGLFDGSRKMEGSSADIARLLQMPVLLVLNAKAMAYSAAAILYGLKNFCSDIRIAGVIFNFVESSSHYRFLQEACEDVGVQSFGYLPSNDALHIKSRHLGLDILSPTQMHAAIAAAADHIEKHIDIDALLNGAGIDLPTAVNALPSSPNADPARKNILVAQDAAFNFIYPENIRALKQFGTVGYFSPLEDAHLPNADLIYLPGGYPELFLEKLSANAGMIQQMQTHYVNGGKILAECGGMMYLGKYIADENGTSWPMTGILDLATSMQYRKLSLGYRTIMSGQHPVKGHEFHYSQFSDEGTNLTGVNIPVYNARNELTASRIFYNRQVFASYIHLYWAEHPAIIADLLNEH